MRLDKYAKAFTAAALAGLATTYTALLDNAISTPEWVLIVSSVLGNLALTWAVPNAPMPTVKAPRDV